MSPVKSSSSNDTFASARVQSFAGKHSVGPARAIEVTAARHVVHVPSNSDEERFGRIRTVVAGELRERVVPLFRLGQRRAWLLLLPEQTWR